MHAHVFAFTLFMMRHHADYAAVFADTLFHAVHTRLAYAPTRHDAMLFRHYFSFDFLRG